MKKELLAVAMLLFAGDPGGTQTCRFHHVGKGTGQGWKLESYRDE